MHTSFTGSTKKARQVNLQGRVNVNGWSKAAGPANTVAQAQAEREKRALDRRRLSAAKNIQRVWRGHRSRREKQLEWRDQYDAHEQQALSSGQTLARSPEDLAGQLRLLLRFFNLKSLSDHQRLLVHAERWGTVRPARDASEHDGLLGKLGVKLASALAVFDQVATIEPAEESGLGGMQAPNTYARTIANEIKELRDERQWQAFCLRVPDRYLQSMCHITRFAHCTPDYASKVFLALARLIEWAPQPLPERTQGLVAKNAIDCIVGCSASETPSDEASSISATLEVHSEFVGRLLTLEGLYKLPKTLSALAAGTNLAIIAKSVNLRLEKQPRWLAPQDARNILNYLCYSRRTLNTPETRALSTLVAITALLELAEQLPEDSEIAEGKSIDRFLADIAALPGVDSATTAKIMAKYALSLLRAFSIRAYDIRMRIFLNPTASTSSGKPLTSIEYFWQASRQTDIFKIVTQNQRNVLPLLKPEFSTETEQIGRRGLAAKLVLQSWKDDWRLILFFFEMYTSALKLMDDEEFFLSDKSTATFGSDAKEDNRRGRGSLPLTDIVQMVTFLKNLTYTLYWNTSELSTKPESRDEFTARLGAAIAGGETRSSTMQPDLAGLEGVNLSYLKGLTTGVLRMLHERDSRRKFLPENSWLMTSQVDMTSFIPEVVYEEEKRITLGDIEEEVESEDDLEDAAAPNTSDWSSRISGRTSSYGFPARSNIVANRFVRKQERAQRRNQVAAVAPRLELLRNLPFFIPFETRVNIFRQFVHNDQYRRRNGAIDPHVWRMTVEHMELGRGAGRELLSRHTAKIRRESVFDDAFEQFYPLGEGLKEPIYIKFFDSQGIEERGIDGGGVTKEFLTSITSQAFSPDPPGLSWFVENDQHYLHPNSDLYEILLERSRRLGHEPRSEETLESTRNLRQQYEFMGRVVGKCLYEGILIDVRFAGFFLLKWALTGGTTSATNETAYRATLNDMRDMDPDIYHHLLALKNWTGNVEEDFGLNFTITDNMTIDETGKTFSRTRELIPNGASTPVTNANRLLYIDRFVRYRLQYHPKVVTDAFLKGLGQMIEPMWLAMFNQKELQWLIGGDDNELDLLDLRRNTDLGGIYQRGDDPADHPTIELFWAVLKEMDDRDRREVLRFATSTPRAPLLGFSNLNPRFSIRDSTNDEGRHDLNRLPTSSTCVNQLKLPPYTSKALMREKLLYAARSGAGFDLSGQTPFTHNQYFACSFAKFFRFPIEPNRRIYFPLAAGQGPEARSLSDDATSSRANCGKSFVPYARPEDSAPRRAHDYKARMNEPVSDREKARRWSHLQPLPSTLADSPRTPHFRSGRLLTAPTSRLVPHNTDIELKKFSRRRLPQTDGSSSFQIRGAREEDNPLDRVRRLAEKEAMKFSHSIQFNAVPDWSSHYISYSNLKKLIYTLEKQINHPQDVEDEEQSALLGGQQLDPDTTFRRMLDSELEKVGSFYRLKELELFGEVEHLLKDEEQYKRETEGLDMEEVVDFENRRKQNRTSSIFNMPFRRKRRTSTMSVSVEEPSLEHDVEDSDSDAEDGQPGLRKKPSMKQRSQSSWEPRRRSNASMSESREDLRSSTISDGGPLRRRQSIALQMDHEDPNQMSALYDSGITLKKRTISLYVSLCELKSFIQLNQTGFKKASKKYDKVCNRNIRKDYMEKVVNVAYPFRETTMTHIDSNIHRIEGIYADVVTKGDLDMARRELRLHLREHVVWERNTVWREMIGIERKAQAANFGIRQTLLGHAHDPTKSRLQGDEENLATKEVSTPLGRYRCPKWLFSSTFLALIFILAIFFTLLFVPIMKKPEQQNCLAMLVLVSLMWATEVIPLFVTSLMVPFLVVVLRIMRSEDKPHRRLESKEATKVVFAAMWTPVIMLLLGGFTIAAALSKYHIAKMMATFVLSKAGTKPRTVLITNMFVGMFLSMWISNVAAPVLCFSIIQPMLRNLPADSSMSKALILGIALASNIGGAASPIASPQNIIALQNMNPSPSWGIWFFIALPVCIITIVLIWVLLLITFKPGQGTTIVPIRKMSDKINGIQWFIIAVTLSTIVLWCTSHQLEGVFGDMGVIAIIPLALFFGTGILTKEDFNNFLWTIIILAAGGLSLGKAVSSSGLLHTIASGITSSVEGMSLYGVMIVFAALILVVATFISHTVAALIILPLVQQVGASMAEPHPNLLVMVSALLCSCAMGLPTSGFPNMTAIMMENEAGQRYLSVKHFLTRGVPASIMAFIVVISVGYGLSVAAGL